ncbi:MAG: ARMT1-like domain-containing protein, partial [bacterium]
LGFNVTIASREVPVINDMTKEDTEDLLLRLWEMGYFTEYNSVRLEVISSGSRIFATPVASLSSDFLIRFQDATTLCVIAMGQGNAESLWQAKLQKPFVHILMAKNPEKIADFIDISRHSAMLIVNMPTSAEDILIDEIAYSGAIVSLIDCPDFLATLHGLGVTVINPKNIYLYREELMSLDKFTDCFYGEDIILDASQGPIYLGNVYFSDEVHVNGRGGVVIRKGSSLGVACYIENSTIISSRITAGERVIKRRVETINGTQHRFSRREVADVYFSEESGLLGLSALSVNKPLLARLLGKGVRILGNPAMISIAAGVHIESGAVIHSGVVLAGDTVIRRGAEIGVGSFLIDTEVEAGARVTGSRLDYCFVHQDAEVDEMDLENEEVYSYVRAPLDQKVVGVVIDPLLEKGVRGILALRYRRANAKRSRYSLIPAEDRRSEMDWRQVKQENPRLYTQVLRQIYEAIDAAQRLLIALHDDKTLGSDIRGKIVATITKLLEEKMLDNLTLVQVKGVIWQIIWVYAKSPFQLHKKVGDEQAMLLVEDLLLVLDRVRGRTPQELAGERLRLAMMIAALSNLNIFDYARKPDAADQLSLAPEEFRDVLRLIKYSRNSDTVMKSIRKKRYFTVEDTSTIIDRLLAVPGAERRGKTILFNVNNAGEVVYSLVLIREILRLGYRVVISAKARPIDDNYDVHDMQALLQDPAVRSAQFLGPFLDAGMIRVISNGSYSSGIDLDDVSADFYTVVTSQDTIMMFSVGHTLTKDMLAHKLPVPAVSLLWVKDEVTLEERGLEIARGEAAIIFVDKTKNDGLDSQNTESGRNIAGSSSHGRRNITAFFIILCIIAFYLLEIPIPGMVAPILFFAMTIGSGWQSSLPGFPDSGKEARDLEEQITRIKKEILQSIDNFREQAQAAKERALAQLEDLPSTHPVVQQWLAELSHQRACIDRAQKAEIRLGRGIAYLLKYLSGADHAKAFGELKTQIQSVAQEASRLENRLNELRRTRHSYHFSFFLLPIGTALVYTSVASPYMQSPLVFILVAVLIAGWLMLTLNIKWLGDYFNRILIIVATISTIAVDFFTKNWASSNYPLAKIMFETTRSIELIEGELIQPAHLFGGLIQILHTRHAFDLLWPLAETIVPYVLLAVPFIIYFGFKRLGQSRLSRFAFGLMVGGIFANALEHAFQGYVTNWLFIFGLSTNLADILPFVGLALTMLLFLLDHPKEDYSTDYAQTKWGYSHEQAVEELSRSFDIADRLTKLQVFIVKMLSSLVISALRLLGYQKEAIALAEAVKEGRLRAGPFKSFWAQIREEDRCIYFDSTRPILTLLILPYLLAHEAGALVKNSSQKNNLIAIKSVFIIGSGLALIYSTFRGWWGIILGAARAIKNHYTHRNNKYPATMPTSHRPDRAPKPRELETILTVFGGRDALAAAGVTLDEGNILISPALEAPAEVRGGILYINPNTLRGPPEQLRVIFEGHELYHLQGITDELRVRQLTLQYLFLHNLLTSHIEFLKDNTIGLNPYYEWLEYLKEQIPASQQNKQEVFEFGGKQGWSSLLTSQRDGGYAIDADTGTTLYWAEAASEFLRKTTLFAQETYIILPFGTTATVQVEGESFTLSEVGGIYINSGRSAKINVKGKVLVITTAQQPSWYQRYGLEGSFAGLFSQLGYNKSGLLWEKNGVVVYVLSLRKNLWNPTQGTEWIVDPVSYGGERYPAPIIAVSRVSWFTSEEQSVDFSTIIRQSELLRQHPMREGAKKQLEVYIAVEGRMGLLIMKDGKPYLCVLNPGDMAFIQPGIIHKILVVGTPYEHLVVQVPGAFQYGLWFKEEVSPNQFPSLMNSESIANLAKGILDKGISGVFELSWPGAIGKFLIRSVSYDQDKGVVNIEAVHAEQLRKGLQHLHINGARAPPVVVNELLQQLFSITSDPLVRKIIYWYVDEFARGGITVILGDNRFGILGLGSRDIIAISQRLINNPIAFFHEIAHAYVISHPQELTRIEQRLSAGRIRWVNYKNQALRTHYILRAFQRQVFADSDRSLTQIISDFMESGEPLGITPPSYHQEIEESVYAAQLKEAITALRLPGLTEASLTPGVLLQVVRSVRRQNRGLLPAGSELVFLDNSMNYMVSLRGSLGAGYLASFVDFSSGGEAIEEFPLYDFRPGQIRISDIRVMYLGRVINLLDLMIEKGFAPKGIKEQGIFVEANLSLAYNPDSGSSRVIEEPTEKVCTYNLLTGRLKRFESFPPADPLNDEILPMHSHGIYSLTEEVLPIREARGDIRIALNSIQTLYREIATNPVLAVFAIDGIPPGHQLIIGETERGFAFLQLRASIQVNFAVCDIFRYDLRTHSWEFMESHGSLLSQSKSSGSLDLKRANKIYSETGTSEESANQKIIAALESIYTQALETLERFIPGYTGLDYLRREHTKIGFSRHEEISSFIRKHLAHDYRAMQNALVALSCLWMVVTSLKRLKQSGVLGLRDYIEKKEEAVKRVIARHLGLSGEELAAYLRRDAAIADRVEAALVASAITPEQLRAIFIDESAHRHSKGEYNLIAYFRQGNEADTDKVMLAMRRFYASLRLFYRYRSQIHIVREEINSLVVYTPAALELEDHTTQQPPLWTDHDLRALQHLRRLNQILRQLFQRYLRELKDHFIALLDKLAYTDREGFRDLTQELQLDDVRLIFKNPRYLNQQRLERIEQLITRAKAVANRLNQPYELRRLAFDLAYHLALLRKAMNALRDLKTKGPPVLDRYLREKAKESDKSSQALVKALKGEAELALSTLLNEGVQNIKLQKITSLLARLEEYLPGPFVIAVELSDTARILEEILGEDYRLRDLFDTNVNKRQEALVGFRSNEYDIILVSTKSQEGILEALADFGFVLLKEKRAGWNISSHKPGSQDGEDAQGTRKQAKQLPLFCFGFPILAAYLFDMLPAWLAAVIMAAGFVVPLLAFYNWPVRPQAPEKNRYSDPRKLSVRERLEVIRRIVSDANLEDLRVILTGPAAKETASLEEVEILLLYPSSFSQSGGIPIALQDRADNFTALLRKQWPGLEISVILPWPFELTREGNGLSKAENRVLDGHLLPDRGYMSLGEGSLAIKDESLWSGVYQGKEFFTTVRQQQHYGAFVESVISFLCAAEEILAGLGQNRTGAIADFVVVLREGAAANKGARYVMGEGFSVEAIGRACDIIAESNPVFSFIKNRPDLRYEIAASGQISISNWVREDLRRIDEYMSAIAGHTERDASVYDSLVNEDAEIAVMVLRWMGNLAELSAYPRVQERARDFLSFFVRRVLAENKDILDGFTELVFAKAEEAQQRLALAQQGGEVKIVFLLTGAEHLGSYVRKQALVKGEGIQVQELLLTRSMLRSIGYDVSAEQPISTETKSGLHQYLLRQHILDNETSHIIFIDTGFVGSLNLALAELLKEQGISEDYLMVCQVFLAGNPIAAFGLNRLEEWSESPERLFWFAYILDKGLEVATNSPVGFRDDLQVSITPTPRPWFYKLVKKEIGLLGAKRQEEKANGQVQSTIMVVCEANVFRSPILAYRLSKLIGDSPLRIISRGLTHRLSGMELVQVREEIYASLRSKLSARELDQLFPQDPRVLDVEDMHQAGLILAATRSVRLRIIQQYPEAASRVFLMSEFLPQNDELYGKDIPDLGYGGYFQARHLWESYDRVLPVLSSELDSLSSSLPQGSVGYVFETLTKTENINRAFSREEIATLVKRSANTVRYDISALCELGLIEKAPLGNYIVKDEIKSHISRIRPLLKQFKGHLLRPTKEQLKITKHKVTEILGQDSEHAINKFLELDYNTTAVENMATGDKAKLYKATIELVHILLGELYEVISIRAFFKNDRCIAEIVDKVSGEYWFIRIYADRKRIEIAKRISRGQERSAILSSFLPRLRFSAKSNHYYLASAEGEMDLGEANERLSPEQLRMLGNQAIQLFFELGMKCGIWVLPIPSRHQYRIEIKRGAPRLVFVDLGCEEIDNTPGHVNMKGYLRLLLLKIYCAIRGK